MPKDAPPGPCADDRAPGRRTARGWRVLAGVGGILVVLRVGFGIPMREPQHGGRSVSEWLDAYAARDARPGVWVDRRWGPRRLRDSQTGRPASDLELEAFQAMGATAVPALTRHVRTGFLDSDRYVTLLAQLPSRVVELLPRPWDRATRRFFAIEILLSLGPEARSAVPALVSLLEATGPTSSGPGPMGIPMGGRLPGRPFVPAPPVRDRARLVEAVCRICGDPATLEPLLLGLGRARRFRSLVDLATFGGWQGSELAGLLAAAQDDPYPEVRGGALRLLEANPHPVPPVMGRMVRALQDPDDTVRWLAARALEASGSRDPEVVAALRQATGDTSRMVRTVSRRTLEQLARDPSGPAEAQ